MQAGVLRAPNERVELVGLARPEPWRGRVRVRRAASGACRSDRPVVHGAMRQPLPCVLGHERAGVGEALDTRRRCATRDRRLVIVDA